MAWDIALGILMAIGIIMGITLVLSVLGNFAEFIRNWGWGFLGWSLSLGVIIWVFISII